MSTTDETLLPDNAADIGLDFEPAPSAPSVAPIDFTLRPSPSAAPPLPVAPEQPAPAPAAPTPAQPGSDSIDLTGLLSPTSVADTAFTPPARPERQTPRNEPAPTDAARSDEPAPRYEETILNAASGDAKRRPTEGAWRAAKDVTPFEGEDARRAWLRRVGLDPNDTTEDGRRRQEQFLGFERDLQSLGYNQKRLREIADTTDETKRDTARKALFEAGREKIVARADQTISAMRDQLETALQREVDTARAAATATQRAEIDDRARRALETLDRQRRVELDAQQRIQQENRLNSYIVPTTGKVAYLPGFTPREAARSETLQARFDSQRETILRQHQDAIGRLEQSVDKSEVTMAQERMRTALKNFDREERVRRPAAVRSQLASFNEFLQARFDDAKSPTTDGGLPLPYTNDATQLQDLRKRASSGGTLSLVSDFTVEVGRGALGSVIGLGQLATAGVDMVLGSNLSAGPQAASDYVGSIADWLESDAMAAQRELQARRIAEATKGKEGLAAAGAALKAGASSLGFDRATLGMVGQMVGGLATGSVLGRAGGMAGRALGSSKAAGAVIEELATPGVLRQAAASATSPVALAFAGQAADSASHDVANMTRDLFNDPRFTQNNPVLQSLRTQFPSYSEEQIKDLFVRRTRNAAAVAGGATTLLTMMIPGLNGVEGQLARIGAPMSQLIAPPAASVGRFATARGAAKTFGDVVLAPAASNAAQQGVIDAGVAGAASLATGENLFDVNRQAASLGSAGAFGGLVGGGLRARERSRMSAAEALRQPDPPPPATLAPDAPAVPPGIGNPLRTQPSPSADFVGPMPAQLALPSPEMILRSDKARVRAEAARIAGGVERLPEIQRTLEVVHDNYDAAVGAQVATTVGEHMRNYNVALPDGAIVHFANPDAHYSWVRQGLQPNEQVIFSTPDSAYGFAVTRSVDDAGVATVRVHERDRAVTLDALTSADPSSPEYRLATRGAAVLDGLNELGVDLGTKFREKIDVANVLRDTAQSVAELKRADLYEGGARDPAVYAAGALQTRADLLSRIGEASDATKAALRSTLGLEAGSDIGRELLRSFSDDAAATWIDGMRREAADINLRALPRADRKAAGERRQALREAENLVEQTRIVADEMRLAIGAVTGGGGDTPAQAASVKQLRAIIETPLLQVEHEVRALTLGSVPNTGIYRPGSTKVFDPLNPRMRDVLFDNAVYGLVEQLTNNPNLNVAQARNLALHLGGGLHVPGVVIERAISELKNVQASRAAAARAAQIAHDEVTTQARAIERQTEAMRALAPETPAERMTAVDLVRDAVARRDNARLEEQRAVLSAETRARLDYGGAWADFYQDVGRRRRLFAADFERAKTSLEDHLRWERDEIVRGVLAESGEVTRQQAQETRAAKAEAQGARRRDGATRRSTAPDGYTLLGQRAAQPIDAATLQQVAEAMSSKFRDLKLTFRVVQDDADRASGGSRGYAALTVNDASGGGVTILLNRDRIGSVADAKRAVWHELYGHYTPEQLLGPAKFGRVLETVLTFAEAGDDPQAAQFLLQFRRDYRDAFGVEPSTQQKAAEVLSHLIETNRLQPDALTERLKKVFGGSDFARNGLTRADLQFLLDKVVDLSAGNRETIEQARAAVLARDSFIEPDYQLRDQRRVPAIRSAFSSMNRLWPFVRGMLDGRYYTTRPGALLLTEAPNDAGVRTLVDRFNYGLRNILAQASSVWQMTYKDPIDRINRAVTQAARESGRPRAAVLANVDRLITARHALERNAWGTRLRAPMPFDVVRQRDAIVAEWRDRKITNAEMAARIDALQTPEVLRRGMEDFVTDELKQVFDPIQHPFMPDDARYAGRDLTPKLARLEIERLTADPIIAALEKRVAPDLQTMRANMLEMQRSTGYDPHNFASLFADTYVPIRPQGELQGKNDYEHITLDYSTSTAKMQGLGDKMASTGQIETMINLTRRAASDKTNQRAIVDFVDILQRLAKIDGRLVRVLDKSERFDATHDAMIAVVRNIGRFGARAEDAPERSGLDRSMVVRDRDGQLGGEKGDFYEVIVRDKNIIKELQLTKPEEAGMLSTARFVLRSAQSAWTHFNPGFLARNAWNDTQQAVMSGTKYGVANEVSKHIARMYGEMGSKRPAGDLRALRAYMMGSPSERAAFMEGSYEVGTPEYWTQMFVANGGHMVFESLSSAPAETVQARDAVDWLQRRAETSHIAAIEKAAAGLEVFKKGTELMENVSRLALFRALVEKGVDPTAPEGTERGFSPDRAAAESKALTLDYHHISPLGRTLGALYAFANPTIADLHASLTNRIWKGGKPPVDTIRQADGTMLDVFRPGWAKELDTNYIKTRVALMLGQVMLVAAVLSPDEWEKVTLEDLSNQWHLPGDLFGQPGQMVKLSKNYGVDRLIDMAIALPVMAYFGRGDVERMARDFYNVSVKNLSPGIDLNMREDTPVLLDLIRGVMPTLGQPALDFATGYDRFGKQTRASDFYRDGPAYRATTMGANPLFADMARSLYRNNIGNWTGDQVQQLLRDYSTMIPVSRIFTDFALAFGRQSAQAEINEATGRPELSPAAQFTNSLGGPIAFRESTFTAETEVARIRREHVQPALMGRADAAQQDIEAKQAPKGRRRDSLDLAQMGPREREFMRERPKALALLQVERDFKQEREAARNAMLAARAQGDGPGFVRAATAYRRVSEQMVGRMKTIIAR